MSPLLRRGEPVFKQPTTNSAQLALDTILQKPVLGIPSWLLNVMEQRCIERFAGVGPGEYRRHPDDVYLTFQRAVGTCLLDQYLADNPLTIGDHGFESTPLGATTGANQIVVDGYTIDSPEALVNHLEHVEFVRLRERISNFDMPTRVREIIDGERRVQELIGPSMLKSGYEFIQFPTFAYGIYGYTNYFMAYGLYPEIIERHFALQADLATLNNRAAAAAYTEGNLPPLFRLDHDMADSRGTLVDIRSLDRIWFPHFARCLEPLLRTNVRLIWHCDGNLMQMVPRLLEVGLHGFQGFQYEDGMDYPRICTMKTRTGESLIIIAGVSVTRTLPFGTPSEVRSEIDWLVEYGPRTGLFLGGSSSIAPGVPWANLQIMVEAFRYYYQCGRSGR